MSALLALKQRLEHPVQETLACVYAACEGRAELIPEISRYIISSGGKRIRPLLCLAAADLTGYEGKGGPALAASVECIHTATLLHDDVVDNSAMRRGRSSANAVWGNKESVLVGDFLLSRAFDMMAEARSLTVYRLLSNAALIITEGEILQLAALKDGEWNEERYHTVIKAKTAALFAAACAAPAAAAERPQEQVDALYRFGMHLGTAFQIADDALDYFMPTEESGKPAGADFFEGKITLPLLSLEKALVRDGRRTEAAALRSLMTQEGERTEETFSAVLTLMHEFNARGMVQMHARDSVEEAIRHITGAFPRSEILDLMTGLAHEVAART